MPFSLILQNPTTIFEDFDIYEALIENKIQKYPTLFLFHYFFISVVRLILFVFINETTIKKKKKKQIFRICE